MSGCRNIFHRRYHKSVWYSILSYSKINEPNKCKISHCRFKWYFAYKLELHFFNSTYPFAWNGKILNKTFLFLSLTQIIFIIFLMRHSRQGVLFCVYLYVMQFVKHISINITSICTYNIYVYSYLVLALTTNALRPTLAVVELSKFSTQKPKWCVWCCRLNCCCRRWEYNMYLHRNVIL